MPEVPNTSNQRSEVGRSTCRPYKCQLITSTDNEIRFKLHPALSRELRIYCYRRLAAICKYGGTFFYRRLAAICKDGGTVSFPPRFLNLAFIITTNGAFNDALVLSHDPSLKTELFMRGM